MAFSSCYRRLYYLSPYTATQSTYHAMPMLTDKSRTANYFTLATSFGSANQLASDNVFIAQGKWHQSRKFGKQIQGYFGAQFNVGSYKARTIGDTFNAYYIDYSKINALAGKKFTAAAGVTAGAAYVVSLGSRHEWRVIGIEGALSREFGDYQQFREKLPDSIVTIVDKRRFPATIGGYTEMVFKPANERIRFGFQVGIGTGIFPQYSTTATYSKLRPRYFYQTFQFTYDRYTSYFSGRFGNYFSAIQLGISYRF
jgi:hypothetical protein